MPRALVIASFVVATSRLAAQPVEACRIPQPRITWPVDFGQGFAHRRHEAALYAAALRIAPTLGIGCDRAIALAPVVAPTVLGSDARIVGGAGVSVRVARPSGFGSFVSVPVFLSAESLWGEDRRLVTGALTVDALRAVRLTLRAGRELDAKRSVFELALGTDLGRWIGGRTTPARPPAAGEFDDLDPFPRHVAVRMSARASWLIDPGEERALDSARAIVDVAERAPSVDALRAMVTARGPRRLVETIDRVLRDAPRDAQAEHEPVPPMDDPIVQRKLVVALVRGWRAAMRHD